MIIHVRRNITRLALALMVTFFGAPTVHASIVWAWSNAGTGTETGTFTTDGELISGSAPAGTYTLSDFSLTATSLVLPLGSVSAGDYVIPSPDVGFIWDGAGPTQFFRGSGGATNGFSIQLAVEPALPLPFEIVFAINSFVVQDADDEDNLRESLAVNLAPLFSIREPISVDFLNPASLVLLMAGIAGLGALMRRRRIGA